MLFTKEIDNDASISFAVLPKNFREGRLTFNSPIGD